MGQIKWVQDMDFCQARGQGFEFFDLHQSLYYKLGDGAFDNKCVVSPYIVPRNGAYWLS